MELLNVVFHLREIKEVSIGLNLDVSPSSSDKTEFSEFMGYKGSISSIHHCLNRFSQS